jgi:hypothetical protein
MVSPFDKLRALSLSRGLSNHYPDLKIGVWRRRTYQFLKISSFEKTVEWNPTVFSTIFDGLVKSLKGRFSVIPVP